MLVVLQVKQAIHLHRFGLMNTFQSAKTLLRLKYSRERLLSLQIDATPQGVKNVWHHEHANNNGHVFI